MGEREKKAALDLADSIAKKILHLPQMALRDDDPDEGVSLVVAVQRLFALEVQDAPVAVVKDDVSRAAGKKAAGS